MPTAADTLLPALRNLFGEHISRDINVRVREGGKKEPLNERNDMGQSEIEADPGKGDWVSIYLNHCVTQKHVLAVVDIDTNERTGLDEALAGNLCTVTTKGRHYYCLLTPDDALPKRTQKG